LAQRDRRASGGYDQDRSSGSPAYAQVLPPKREFLGNFIGDGWSIRTGGRDASGDKGDAQMNARAMFAAVLLLAPAAALGQTAKPTDPQIAHIAYTAGQIDIAAAQQALKISKDQQVREFAQEMVRDHTAVNDKALALVKKLNVTPQDNPTSQSLKKDADAKLASYSKLSGAAFDRAYMKNEVAYHKTVNGALETTLIPNAKNAELKSLLQTGLKLFREHQHHAEALAPKVK
jgi:putative membrane protein